MKYSICQATFQDHHLLCLQTVTPGGRSEGVTLRPLYAAQTTNSFFLTWIKQLNPTYKKNVQKPLCWLGGEWAKLEEVLEPHLLASPQVPISQTTNSFLLLACWFRNHLQMFLVAHLQPQLAEKTKTWHSSDDQSCLSHSKFHYCGRVSVVP